MTGSDTVSRPLYLVTGMHRSGTTWVGEVIAHAQSIKILHEPFNANSGLIGVDKWYYGPAEASYIAGLLQEMLNGERSYRRRRGTDGLVKNLMRTVAGSQYEHDLTAALAAPEQPIVMKDPFLIRLGADLARDFGAKGVILVRHPAAMINSLKRMNWRLPNLDDRAPEVYSADSDIQFCFQIGMFWGGLYAEVLDQVRTVPEQLMLVRHEELCNEPVQIGQDILTHLDMPFTDSARDFLTKSTSGNVGELSGDQLHNMYRDAQKLAQSWRSSITKEQLMAVQAGAGKILQQIYPE